MQGLWKENISGWNHKDSKRKKWKRKHTIKNKIYVFQKYADRKYTKFSKRPIRNNIMDKYSKVVLEYKELKITEGAKEPVSYMYRVYAYYIETGEKKEMIAMDYNGIWYESDIEYTFMKLLTYKSNIHHTKIKVIPIEIIDEYIWDNYPYEENIESYEEFDDTTEYLYGKPVNFYPSKYKYSRTDTRKIINGSSRSYVRNWIKTSQWEEKDIDFPPLKGLTDKYHEWWY